MTRPDTQSHGQVVNSENGESGGLTFVAGEKRKTQRKTCPDSDKGTDKPHLMHRLMDGR